MRPQPLSVPQLTPAEAFWRGVVTALVVVLPAGIFNQWLVDAGDVSKGSPAVLFFWLLILFGGAAGGWAVIRLCQSAPLSAAAGAAALAYAIVQGLGVVKRVIWGPHEFSPVGYIFLLLLMATCGMLGGLFGRRWQREQDATVERSRGRAAETEDRADHGDWSDDGDWSNN